MVYGFARQSGGAIRIESILGEGTRVEMWLPRAPEAAIEPLPDDDSARSCAGPDAPVARLNVLLVDDHLGVRATTAALLEDLGHKVTQAGDGPEVLGLLEGDPAAFDLIISDYAMPRLSGAEVVRQARRIRPAMPAILMTGYADARSISRRPEDVHVLAKPFTLEQMSAAIFGASAGAQAPKIAARLARLARG
jgi:CheY-like chemotaxis protein